MAKSTKDQKDRIIREVLELMLKGKHRYDIQQYTATNHGKSASITDEYIAEARKISRARLDIEEEDLVAEAAHRYDMLFDMATTDKQIQSAVQAQKAKTELLGLAKPKKVDLGGSVDATIYISRDLKDV